MSLFKDSSSLPSFIFLSIDLAESIGQTWVSAVRSYPSQIRQQVSLHSTHSSSESAENNVLAFKGRQLRDGLDRTFIVRLQIDMGAGEKHVVKTQMTHCMSVV